MLHNLVERWRGWSAKNTDIVVLPFLLVFVVVLMTILTGGEFLTLGNFDSVAAQIPELGLLSLAMMIVMLTAGINLSIISSANFTGVLMALIMTRFIPEGASQGHAVLIILLAMVVGIVFSALLGLVNGLLVAYVEVPAVLTTLGTMILFEGLTLAITKGFVISGLPEIYLAAGGASLLGVPVPLIILILVTISMGTLFSRTPFGKQLYMLGSNMKATEYSAVDVRKVLIKVYVISAVLTGLAAMIMLVRFNSANARQGSSLLLLTVLICMLGGTDPFGGFGKVLGLFLALITLQLITSGLNLLGYSSFVTVALWGILLIMVMAYRHYQGQRLNQKRMARLRSRLSSK